MQETVRPVASSLSDGEGLFKVKRVKHAGDEALDQLEDLLLQLRTMDGLKEKKRGVFYFRAKALLHFHEEPAGLFVDLREEDGFVRYEVTSSSQRSALLVHVRDQLSPAQ
jgi:hypothetical protein